MFSGSWRDDASQLMKYSPWHCQVSCPRSGFVLPQVNISWENTMDPIVFVTPWNGSSENVLMVFQHLLMEWYQKPTSVECLFPLYLYCGRHSSKSSVLSVKKYLYNLIKCTHALMFGCNCSLSVRETKHEHNVLYSLKKYEIHMHVC